MTSIFSQHRGRSELGAATPESIAGLDPRTGRLERLFNPRIDRWEEHFHWNGAELVGMTATGRVTVALLQINREERAAVRRELMGAALYPDS